MDTTRYTVNLFKDGEIVNYLNTNDEGLAHQTEFGPILLHSKNQSRKEVIPLNITRWHP